MNPQIFADYASALHRRDSYFMTKVGSDREFYAGKGNLCQQVAMEFEALGIEREERLKLLAKAFGYAQVSSMKDMTIGQLKAILALNPLLGELRDGVRQVH